MKESITPSPPPIGAGVFPHRLLAALSCITFLLLHAMESRAAEVRLPVRVHHPGINSSNAVDHILIQRTLANGRDYEYYIETDSVSCGNDRCTVVPVRLFWDQLGFYLRIELEPETHLEKGKDRPFTAADYRKLDQVLANRNTDIWKVWTDQLVQYRPSEKETDGVTAATILPDKSLYVQGAVWTCHTLWNWANGDIPGMIRDRTGESRSLAELQSLLQSGTVETQVFALEQLARRRAYGPATFKSVSACVSSRAYELLWALSAYAEGADPQQYYLIMDTFIHAGNPRLRVICMDSLLGTDHPAPPGFYKKLAAGLADHPAYVEINRFLHLLEKKDAVSPDVTAALFPLLESDNLLVVRRTYRFLEQQELPDNDRTRLADFAAEHADTL
jgi:hypothetical protein